MEQLLLYFKNLNLNWQSLAITGGVLLIGSVLTGLFSRFIFGKRSILGDSASSAMGIIFIYVVTAVIYSVGSAYISYTVPLPFVTIDTTTISLVQIYGSDYTTLSGILLNMVILSFLMNIIDRWLPKGQHIIPWVFWRCISIVATMLLHLFVTGLMNKYLPQGILTYAPVILLGLIAIMILTGALKILVGVILSSVNPLVAALYTFFFANIIGKQVTKAVFTTCIITGLFFLLEQLGINSLSISPEALIAYIPYGILLTVLWFATKRLV